LVDIHGWLANLSPPERKQLPREHAARSHAAMISAISS
jgi:hypothetical protein